MFKQFGLSKPLLKAIETIGFETPTPIQEKVIPLIMQGQDVIGQAKTGTGKTAAFALPVLEQLDADLRQVQMLVMTPTRELAAQVCDEIQRFGRFVDIKCTCISGGNSYARQIESVKGGAQVIVATPGRLLDLMKSRRIPKMNPSVVVLDEADEMLDMGFLEDIRAIFEHIPEERQTLLFSATMPPAIQKLARKILKDPQIITTNAGEEITNQDITQEAYLVEENERERALVRLLDAHQPFKSIIFCRTRMNADQLSRTLVDFGYSSAALHGDLEQRQRERVLGSFKEGRINILVATDVAARGLNVTDVSHVFNYHLPCGIESYVHRIGRTGRAGNKGIAATLVNPSEFHKLGQIQQKTGSKINTKCVPSLQDVKRNKFHEFSDELGRQSIHPDAEKFLKNLEKFENESELSLKMVSMLLSNIKVAGPERIGLDPKSFKETERRPKFRPGGRRGGGGYRGGDRNSSSRRGDRSSGDRGGFRGFKKRSKVK